MLEAYQHPTADACVDTYDEFDDFGKMRERLREASDKNAALVSECTNLRMKAWQDEERVRLARRQVEDARTEVKVLEGKVEGLQRSLYEREQKMLQAEYEVAEKVCWW